MKVIAGYRYYTSEEQDKWCKKHGVPPVHKLVEKIVIKTDN